jgi:hypothetical protein
LEYALFISSAGMLKDPKNLRLSPDSLPLPWRPSPAGERVPFGRLYFGQEFCQVLVPSGDELGEALGHARKEGMAFTLVTPFVTDEGLRTWMEVIGQVAGVEPRAEVVFNDLGLAGEALGAYPGLKALLGRLLVKQKRGPRIKRLMGRVPREMIDHFARFNADVPHLSEFYRGMGFERYELDNTIQGIIRDGDTPASLYYPYLYVTTTRMCLVNGCDGRKESLRAIFPCKRECRHVRFRITHGEMPAEVMLAGNTQFAENRELPPDPAGIGVDRLVYQPGLPL